MVQTPGKRVFSSLLTVLLAVVGATSVAAEPAVGDSAATFERLKQLEGTWRGEARREGGEQKMAVPHAFAVTANGEVLKETFVPGHDHEMVSMYYLNGDQLEISHFCDSGNHPVLRLDPESSSQDELHFEFVKSVNFDPAKDYHIHAGKLAFIDADTIESSWTIFIDGKKSHVLVFRLERAAAEHAADEHPADE